MTKDEAFEKEYFCGNYYNAWFLAYRAGMERAAEICREHWENTAIVEQVKFQAPMQFVAAEIEGLIRKEIAGQAREDNV